MQIGYIKNAKNLKPIILDASKYLEAADYSIEKEKLAICSSSYDFILFIFWIGFGLSFLDSLVQIDSFWLKAVVFVDLFIVINWFLTLPFELYSTFKLNKKYGFSNMTPALFIKDTIKNVFMASPFKFGVTFSNSTIFVVERAIMNNAIEPKA